MLALLAIAIALPAAAEQKTDKAAFLERSRMVLMLGRTETAAAMRAAEKVLAARETTAQGNALRRLLLEALGKNPRPEAFSLIQFALADPDPGVRIAAAAALGDRFAPVLYDLAGKDPWPEVRRAALDRLVASRAPGLQDYLLAQIFDRALPYDAREHAAALYDFDAAPLAARITRIEEEAHVTALAHPLLRRIIAILGKKKPPQARALLIRIAEHSPLPGARAEALLALSHFCDKDSILALKRGLQDDEREVVLASQRAQGVCSLRNDR